MALQQPYSRQEMIEQDVTNSFPFPVLIHRFW
jgi:hypothetical protein